MEKIYSKAEPSRLLHLIYRKEDFVKGRTNAVEDENYLQCALLNLKAGHTFKPHRHLYKIVQKVFPQESWIVLKGKVKCIFYDITDEIIAEPILEEGDVSFSLTGGGHNYLILEDAIVAEYKVGPYFGVEQDKVFI